MPDNALSALAVTVLIASAWDVSVFSSLCIAVPVTAAWLFNCCITLLTAAIRALVSSEIDPLSSVFRLAINSLPMPTLATASSTMFNRLSGLRSGSPNTASVNSPLLLFLSPHRNQK